MYSSNYNNIFQDAIVRDFPSLLQLGISFLIIYYYVVANSHYLLVIPNELLVKEIDQALIEEHILIPSKYMPNKYESLRGKLYTAEPKSRKLKCTYGYSKLYPEFFTVIVEQDICYTEDGKTYERMLINNILDERYYQLPYKIDKMVSDKSFSYNKFTGKRYHSSDE